MSAPIGYYVTSDDAECASCHRPEDWEGFEEWEAPLPIFYGSEGDAPTHCSSCAELIPHELTDEGYGYVREALARSRGNPEVLAQWERAYRFGLDDRGLAGTAVDRTGPYTDRLRALVVGKRTGESGKPPPDDPTVGL